MTETEQVSTDQARAAPGERRRRVRLGAVPPIWFVLAAVLAVGVWRGPPFAEPASLMGFLKRSAPLLVVALGQLFVIVAGEVGLANGVVTTLLRVPSFITTLGAMLVLGGAVFLWTGGSPTGALADNLRRFGRSGIMGVPLLGQLPYAVLVVVVVTVLATVLLHHTRFGHQVFAVGGGVRAAMLSGVDVWRIRTASFVISALSAVVAAILLAGYAGLSTDSGAGYEFQAITTVVLAGAVLGGGRGSTVATVGGALTLQALFTLLNLFGFARPLRDSAEGLLIIAAGAYTAYRARRSG